MIISLDMYQTLFAAVCVLMLGRFLKARIGFLEKFCIPAPVIGGVLFAVFTCRGVTALPSSEFDESWSAWCSSSPAGQPTRAKSGATHR